MTEVFIHLLNISITAGWIVLAVLLLRLFPKIPKWIVCLFWAVVGLRLILPFTIESSFSLIPSPQVIPQDIAVSQTPAIYSGIPAVNAAVNPLFTTHIAPQKNLLEQVLSVAGWVWLAGVGLMLLYSLISYVSLRWRVRASLPLRDNAYLCDNVDFPFVFGTIRPRIYVPSDMEESQLQYVLSHEQAHIRRRDHLWKPLGFFLLTVYWFNPLLWVAYILLCRDIERACDEKVISRLDNAGKKEYSQALLSCSSGHRIIMACPVAFGEVSLKTRIKGILHYKKPAFWLTLAAVMLCFTLAGCFLTNPVACLHSYESSITVAPTCTAEGMQTLTCRQCAHCYTTAVDKLPHSYDDGIVSVKPTCIAQGTRLYTCRGCGAQQTQALEITGHIPGAPYFTVEPNCTEEGHTSATCSYCQAVFITGVLPVNNVHDLHEEVILEATCAAPGQGKRTCSRCNHAESCTYEQLPHHLQTQEFPGTCITCGRIEYRCTDCDYFYVEETELGEHDWVVASSDTYQCTHCSVTQDKSIYIALISQQQDPLPIPTIPTIIWD
ncbi:MAG: hypothetical protein IJO28_07950 [Oscillospiraceae bacterium]|nr:hypothetical protein [Oscillospiraceae bacterium]